MIIVSKVGNISREVERSEFIWKWTGNTFSIIADHVLNPLPSIKESLDDISWMVACREQRWSFMQLGSLLAHRKTTYLRKTRSSGYTSSSIRVPVRRMRCDEATILYLKVCELQGCRLTMPDSPSQGRMKCNEMKWMKCVWRNSGMKFVAGKSVRNSEKTYPDSDLSTTKPTWSDGGANSEPQRWEAID